MKRVVRNPARIYEKKSKPSDARFRFPLRLELTMGGDSNPSALQGEQLGP